MCVICARVQVAGGFSPCKTWPFDCRFAVFCLHGGCLSDVAMWLPALPFAVFWVYVCRETCCVGRVFAVLTAIAVSCFTCYNKTCGYSLNDKM